MFLLQCKSHRQLSPLEGAWSGLCALRGFALGAAVRSPGITDRGGNCGERCRLRRVFRLRQ